jgi:fluoride exporter
MQMYLWIWVGSGFGGILRHFITGTVNTALGGTFPWGTVIVNITGCFVIGFFSALTGPDGRIVASTTTRQFVMTGICGGYTTFSAFGLQTITLAQEGKWLQAGGNVAASVVLCLAATWLGAVAASTLNAMKSA